MRNILHDNQEAQSDREGASTFSSSLADTEPINPYSQTACLDCGRNHLQMETILALWTKWPFKLCRKCFLRRYGTYLFSPRPKRTSSQTKKCQVKKINQRALEEVIKLFSDND